jgi:phosphatidylglycerophosphate synthase
VHQVQSRRRAGGLVEVLTRPARGPANRVTLARALLVCAVAGVALAGEFDGRVTALVALATVALLLDGVDGFVARRTSSASAFGARFDLEVDALLILVLSAYVAPTAGWWVLLIGAARYLFVAAKWPLPWLRGEAPPRPWCKVVAVVQGATLTVAAADVLSLGWTRLLLAGALVLLAESFGRETWELWRASGRDAREAARGTGSAVLTVAAAAVTWAALVLPDRITHLTPGAFVSIPLEGLVLVALALVTPARVRTRVAATFGVLLGVVLVLKLLDLGFSTVLDRPFDPLNDGYYLGPAIGVLGDSIGRPAAVAVAAAVTLLVVGVVVGMCLAAVRTAAASVRHRAVAARAVGTLGVVWGVCALAGVQVAAGSDVASTGAAGLAYGQVHQLRADIADRQVFARQIGSDDLAGDPAALGLDGLRGKDVVLVFVESYGRSAVEGSSYSPGVDAVLDDGSRRLQAAGFQARSAFLTSPTFGAASWLAHATLQSGLWVDSQQRYNQLFTRDRMTLTSAFAHAGWRTVFNDPAITHDWPEGRRFYGFDRSYDSRDVGYRGPKFGYAPIPDQYTLAALSRNELTPDPARPRVMAELDLVSSHHPWTPLPHLVPWDALGDGSVFDGMPEQGQPESEVYRAPDEVRALDRQSGSVLYRAPDDVRALYGQSIQYTMGALTSWLEQNQDPNLVLVVLGDHQPHHYVSGRSPGHDVPVSVIARDPAVTARISGWGWDDGLRPAHEAPVWRMDTFRDRFLTAFAH